MEGDVLMPGMDWTLVLAIGGAVLGGVFGLLRWFALRLLSDIDAKMARIDAISREVERVDSDLKRLMADLPLHYQRRDDAIREYTAMNAKLDRIYELIMEIRRE